MNFNQILKAIVDKEFPPKEYKCPCKNLCNRLGGEEECDNCSFCGTAMEDLDIYQEQSKAFVEYHRGEMSPEKYYEITHKNYA